MITIKNIDKICNSVASIYVYLSIVWFLEISSRLREPKKVGEMNKTLLSNFSVIKTIFEILYLHGYLLNAPLTRRREESNGPKNQYPKRNGLHL